MHSLDRNGSSLLNPSNDRESHIFLCIELQYGRLLIAGYAELDCEAAAQLYCFAAIEIACV